MKCPVFITVRTASTRLPKKALLKISGKPLIQILIEQIQGTKEKKEIIVCTTREKSDDELCTYLQNKKVETFRGDNKDILVRLYNAAKKYHASNFVVIEGDTLFCDPALIDKTCMKLQKTKYDFITWSNLPFGVSPIGIRTNKLRDLVKSKKTDDTETGWGKIIIDSGIFKVCEIKPRDKKLIRPEIRLSMDYKEDFNFAKKIYENVGTITSLIDLINLIDRNSNWLKINKHAQKKYEINFKRKTSNPMLRKKR